MSYIPLKIPAGVVKAGTDYDSRGRWIDSNLMRWHDGDVMQPIGGWALLSNAGSVAVGGPVRGMIGYRRNNGQARIILGTHAKLYDYAAGTLTAITPVGFTAGDIQASGTYYAPTEANTWQIDMFGEDPVACSWSDGLIYTWDSSVGGAATVVDGSAPTGCVGVVVTPERFVVALGAGGDGKEVQWADQESLTVWGATTSNQAGSFPLQGHGNIMAGRAGRQETLIWTDLDLFSMRYIGGELIYSFNKVGSQCGAISRRSMAIFDGRAIWMGRRGFFLYDGFVQPIPCPVGDFVFNQLNQDQRSQIAADVRADFHEVWWYYPSSTSDNDNAVVYNWLGNHWRIEPIDRTAGIDRGVFEFPLAADPSGAIYEHENGALYADEGGSPSYTPYAESGPIELGNGDNVMAIRQFIPDEDSLGEAKVKIFSRFYPTATETDNGFFTLANPTDMRITARQVRVRVQQVTAGMRWGTPRLEAVPGGLR